MVEFLDKSNTPSSGTYAAAFEKNKAEIKSQESQYKLYRALEHTDDFLKEGMKFFCDLLKTVYQENEIILVETFFAQKYIAKDGQVKDFTHTNTNEINVLMKKVNNFFLENMVVFQKVC